MSKAKSSRKIGVSFFCKIHDGDVSWIENESSMTSPFSACALVFCGVLVRNWKHTSWIESWPERLKAMASQVESTHVPAKLRKFVSYHKEFYNLRILLWKYTGASQFLVSQLSITNFCVWSPCRADTFDVIRFQGQHWHFRCYLRLAFSA